MSKVALAASLCLLAAPAVAGADSTPPAGSPAQQCRAERASMGVAAFKATYATNRGRANAFGKCVSKRSRAMAAAEEEASANSSQKCRAEQSDPNFAAGHAGKTFAQFYGTNANGKNGFGKCVSRTAKEQSQTTQHNQVAADVSAAKQCKSERTALGRDAFAVKYGTNHHRRNAFGKCVSKKARASQARHG